MKYWTLLFSVILAVAAASVEYLYKDDPDAKSVIDHTVQTSFEASKKARLVEFYSPVSKHIKEGNAVQPITTTKLRANHC